MEEKPKKDLIGNRIKMIISLMIIVFVIFILASYLINSDFRNTIDTKVLNKKTTEDSSATLEINSDDNPTIYAFDKYITVFNKGELEFYQQNASMVSSIELYITTPYMISNSNYLAIAEDNGNNL